MNDQEIEAEIVAKGLNKAPRVTLDSINAKIASELYMRDPNGLTVCKLTMKNGFSFIGHSAPVSVENYDKELGDKIARERAFAQIWSHEGYLMKEMLHLQHRLQLAQARLADTPPDAA